MRSYPRTTLLIVTVITLAMVVLHGDEVAITHLQVEIAVADAQGKENYQPAPDAMKELQGNGEKWLRVSLPDPTPLKPWCQHVGLILTLEHPIPAGTSFRIHGRARSVSGAKGLSLLRRWGGSKPWEHKELTAEWTNFSVERLASKYATEFITVSLVENPKRRLQPSAMGVFDIADLKVESVPPKPPKLED